MSDYVTKLQDKEHNGLLPRTVLKAIADDNGDYLDSELTASDVNALKNGAISSLSTYTDGTSGLTSEYTLINTSYIYKVGKIVFCWLYLSINGTVSTSTVWATIPEGFRPKRTIYCTGHFFSMDATVNEGISNFIAVNELGSVHQEYSTSMTVHKVAVLGSWAIE